MSNANAQTAAPAWMPELEYGQARQTGTFFAVQLPPNWELIAGAQDYRFLVANRLQQMVRFWMEDQQATQEETLAMANRILDREQTGIPVKPGMSLNEWANLVANSPQMTQAIASLQFPQAPATDPAENREIELMIREQTLEEWLLQLTTPQ